MIRDLLVPFGLKPKKVHTGPYYGDANDRCMAAFIDVMILFALLYPVTSRLDRMVYHFYHQLPPQVNAQARSTGALFHSMLQSIWEARYPWFTNLLITFLLMGVVMIPFQIVYKTTPGKWLVGLKIVRAGTLGPVEWWRYVLRFFAYSIASAPLMLGIMWMSFSKERRGWHDYIAGTVVLNMRPKGWYWKQAKRGYRKLRGKPEPLFVEQPMSEPAAEERHGDGDKPIE